MGSSLIRKCLSRTSRNYVLWALLIMLGTGFAWADCGSDNDECYGAAISDRGECTKEHGSASGRCSAQYQRDVAACTKTYNACMASQAVTGYINPKFIVLGVTYAPPGGNSFVSYAQSSSVATTNAITSTVSDTKSTSTSTTASAKLGGYLSGSATTTTTTTETQSSSDGTSVTLNWGKGNTYQTFGVPVVSYQGVFTPSVNHDYDTIYIWLNPVMIFSATSSSITWKGYGYDAGDQNGMDIIGIELGYLNGDFGAMPASITNLTNRTWAAGQTYIAGQSADLKSADFATIAAADPFSNSNYGANYIGYTPPSPSTSDSRFTLSACSSGNSVSFEQAAPLQTASSYSCTLSYTGTNTTTQSSTTSFSYSTDTSVSASFLSFWKSSYGSSYTLQTSTKVDNSISSTTSSSSTAYIDGIACSTSTSSGPCVPEYSGPTQFNIYQDNLYGTFMFAPVHYY